MKIALFVGGMWVGGVTTYVLDLAGQLKQAGHTVTLVACTCGAWWSCLAEKRIPAVLLPPGRWESNVHHSRRLAEHFIAERYDCVFLNNGQGVTPALYGLHRWPDRMAAILVLHNDLPRVYAHARINQNAWNVAVAGSPKVHQTAMALLPGKPILYIPYGIPLPPLPQLATRRAWEVPLRLLFTGTLQDRHKGVLRLPGILATCREQKVPVRLTVIGEGQDRERLELAFAQREVSDLVEMRGFQPLEAVYQAMQSHHVLLMPSNYEGLPLVSLEAQANGCVPVASRLAGITDVAIQDGVSGFLAGPENTQEFAGHLLALAQDGSRWQSASQAGMDRTRRLFSVEGMGQRYLDLLRQVEAGSYALAASRRSLKQTGWAPFSPQDFLPGPVRVLASRIRRRILLPRTAA